MNLSIDHRQLADEMELFVFDQQVGAGLPLWLPHGVIIRDEIERMVKQLEKEAGYQRVVSPHIARGELYERSGHLECFHENMYPALNDGAENYFLKPMNCPHHHKIFAARPRSYRHLPLRFAEYGQVYRYEFSGSLNGIRRARGLCQNDAHIYIDRRSVEVELERVLELHEACYRALGLKGIRYRLSKCNPREMHSFKGNLEDWLRCESYLRHCLIRKGLDFYESIGDAAFYGPKIDVQVVMRDGKEESLGSIQLDFNSGELFDLKFISVFGEAEAPWIIHRAPLGSHERAIAFLLEAFNGQLPGWLSPVQLALVPVDESVLAECRELAAELARQGIRALVEEGAGSVAKKLKKIHRLRPFAKMVIGRKELAAQCYQIQFREEIVEVERGELENQILKRVQVIP